MPEQIRVAIEDAPEAMKADGWLKAVRQYTAEDDATGEIVALFKSWDDANKFRYDKTATPEDRLNEAERVCRADYYQDVRDTASSIQDELMGRVKDGEHGEALREWLMDHIHETIDGAARVIYTGQAMDCLRYSDNDGAYVDEFGADGLVSDGSINWSVMAFSAFEKDVQERLEADGVDLNAPVPDCEECGSEEQDEPRYPVGEGDDMRLLCESCRDEANGTDDEDDDEEDEDEEDDEPNVAGADSREGE